MNIQFKIATHLFNNLLFLDFGELDLGMKYGSQNNSLSSIWLTGVKHKNKL